ncbi:hypothetical protein KFU94_14680 [Chloroflexi bacterium TSY]|nr:hypothetical protein [Chloroflexi bacterium TSY]WAB21640.1 hypothetical protein [Chloroflexota bacterium]
MSLVIFMLMAVLIFGLFSILWERRWKNRNTEPLEEQIATSPPNVSLTTRVTEGASALWTKLSSREQQPALADLFRTWSDQALAADIEVYNWLNALFDPAYTAFIEHMAEFADEMGFRLVDLVEGQMAQLPSVEQSATQIILNYCRANQQAALAQEDFDGYHLYAAYLQSPTSIDSQRFAQQLYAKLVEQQVVSAPTPELLALTEQERVAQMQDVIRQAAEKPEPFGAVLSAVAAERQQSAADLTVAAIVERAMQKVTRPAMETPTETPAAEKEASEKSVKISA